MKMQSIKFFLLALVVASFAVSCKKSSSKGDVSRGTGWRINDRDGGFQYNTSYTEQEAAPGLVFVEGGTFTMGKVQDDVMHDWNNSPNQQHVQSFYMDETEVTNVMYLEYLDWIKRMFPPSNENYKNIYIGALPDTLVWRSPLGFNENMTNNYLRHPSYAEYPVVGVNWIQAVEYAKWRTDRVNEAALVNEGYIDEKVMYASNEDGNNSGIFSTETYLNNPSQTYGGAIDTLQGRKQSKNDSVPVFAKKESGALFPEYRLPTEAEWEYAAVALNGLREYNNIRGRKKYPWSGEYTRTGAKRTRGDQLANFKQGKGDYGGIAGWSDDRADITNEVKSYPPNDFGLYDMAGNVAEWVADIYRPIVDDEANDFNYFRGNVYMKNQIGEDGKVVVTTDADIQYDTLPQGQIIARTLPGEIAKEEVGLEQTYLRTNYSKADNRNYRDGDPQSTRFFDRFNEEDPSSQTAFEMYNSPKGTVTSDSLGELNRQYDKSNSRTTLIDNQARVYKGGSWKDRAYWLDPAQRRYYPEYMATNYIGFRCAMSKVGAKSTNGGKKTRE
ncbi:gliding motility lipoprotein GldJ [Neptunitalea lumnitzerae]|uniref:Gliding motility lipoprotein GldJ n=1 Tax=Neptunitalea lumnitzerae TaxID=2965509 RepID=A0ABQ5MH90_9FLAO|nr:gliding motility lipoprotein GldJ [Neptunitalea sp. Y10]GLB48781.1 gliding motility lipoprotein GldJ [Neptunitalea sp. Y10]